MPSIPRVLTRKVCAASRSPHTTPLFHYDRGLPNAVRFQVEQAIHMAKCYVRSRFPNSAALDGIGNADRLSDGSRSLCEPNSPSSTDAVDADAELPRADKTRRSRQQSFPTSHRRPVLSAYPERHVRRAGSSSWLVSTLHSAMRHPHVLSMRPPRLKIT